MVKSSFDDTLKKDPELIYYQHLVRIPDSLRRAERAGGDSTAARGRGNERGHEEFDEARVAEMKRRFKDAKGCQSLFKAIGEDADFDAMRCISRNTKDGTSD